MHRVSASLSRGSWLCEKFSSSGDFATLELLGAGVKFSANILFFGSRHTYTVTIEAVTNSKVVFISRETLTGLFVSESELMQNFLAILSDRVHAQNRRLSLLSQKSLRQKIASYLLEMLHDQLEEEGRSPKDVKQIVSTQAVELPVSKEVVARLLAMPRPSFSRELINMEREGLIRVSGRVIWLLIRMVSNVALLRVFGLNFTLSVCLCFFNVGTYDKLALGGISLVTLNVNLNNGDILHELGQFFQTCSRI